jgi:hypothetical protein
MVAEMEKEGFFEAKLGEFEMISGYFHQFSYQR